MNILAMVAHPDDEVLGAGGTLARHAKDGDKVYVAYLTNGVGARTESNQKDIGERGVAAMEASRIIGSTCLITSVVKLFPDNAMDTVSLLEITKQVEIYIKNLKPEIIYTHHSGDLNIDHRICQQAVLTACRPMAGSSVKAIYAMEIPSSTEWNVPTTFQPNRFVDISDTWKTKIAALQCYDKEMREFPHPRSWGAIHSLTTYRGASVGLKMAEAFMVLREIV